MSTEQQSPVGAVEQVSKDQVELQEPAAAATEEAAPATEQTAPVESEVTKEEITEAKVDGETAEATDDKPATDDIGNGDHVDDSKLGDDQVEPMDHTSSDQNSISNKSHVEPMDQTDLPNNMSTSESKTASAKDQTVSEPVSLNQTAPTDDKPTSVEVSDIKVDYNQVESMDQTSSEQNSISNKSQVEPMDQTDVPNNMSSSESKITSAKDLTTCEPVSLNQTAETEKLAPVEQQQTQQENNVTSQQQQQPALPTRQYLDATVVPILHSALSQLARLRPKEPIKFLANYLMEHKDVVQ